MKKIVSMMLVIAMALGTFALPAFAAENANVAKIGETEYATLAEAIAAAGKLGGAKVEILKDFDFDSTKTITVSGNVTLSGAHTISRGSYKGTMFTVKAGSSLTLDGGIVLDGNNNWIFDGANFFADMAAGKTLKTGAKNSYTTSAGTVATAAMISIANGAKAIVNNATIRNCWADNHNNGSIFKVPAGAVLETNEGSLIKHIRSSVAGLVSGTWTMNGGMIDDVYGHNTNGAVVDIRGGVVTINGGEIANVRAFGLNSNSNGILAQVYGESSKLNINGGDIHDNASFAPGNGWGSVVYLNRGGDFTMTGGVIRDTKTDICSAFVSNTATSIELLGGTIEVDVDTVATRFESLIYGDVTVGEDMNIVGAEGARFLLLVEEPDVAEINGTVSGDGTMWLMNYTPIVGNGTVTSDVLIKSHSYYNDPQVALAGANWNCLITVDSVGSGAALIVKPEANVCDGLVRVLESVESGNYLDDASAAAQASSYVAEAGASVLSPVKFYHRLTSAQKSEIVVTFDYNGGVDAQGWSGCQITSAEGFAPAAPAPTKEGFFLVGWEYALDSNPESLDMEGYAAYNGEMIATSLRLVAKWAKPAEAIVEGKVEFNGHLSAGDFTFVLLDSEGNKLATTTNDKDGNFTFVVEDVIPGDYSYTVDQIEGTEEEIVYDEAMINVSVTVNEDGTCVANPEIAVFTNKTVDPATQTISGSVYLDGELADGFEFALVDSLGNLIDTATSENGIFTFGELEFDEAYTARYTISQIIPENTGNVKYDENEITVSVVITRDGDRYSATYSILRASDVAFYNTTLHIHTETAVEGKAPTCTETGLTEGVQCSECGEILTAQEEIPALGHVAGDEIIENVVEATEIAGGSYEIAVYCTVCGAELSREYFVTDPIVTEAPEESTEAPEETTEAPEETTEAPEEITEAPEETTEAPEETTESEEEITEPELPLAPNPETGDASIILAIVAIAVLALAALYIKRRQVIED